MRSLPAISSFAVLCASLALPQTVSADSCEGSHYTYDHGECYDRTGSTTHDMLKMYDDSDRAARDRAPVQRRARTAKRRSGPYRRNVALRCDRSSRASRQRCTRTRPPPSAPISRGFPSCRPAPNESGRYVLSCECGPHRRHVRSNEVRRDGRQSGPESVTDSMIHSGGTRWAGPAVSE